MTSRRSLLFCCHADQRLEGAHASPRIPVFHCSEHRHPARSRSSPQARLEPSTALQERRPGSSTLHLADIADAGIGSLPSQESVRAKKAMNDSRQYVHGNHVDGVVPARTSSSNRICCPATELGPKLGGVQRTLESRWTFPHSWRRPAHASPPAVALSSGRPTKSLSVPKVRALRQALGARWKTGVRDRQGRGSRVVGDVEGGRLPY